MAKKAKRLDTTLFTTLAPRMMRDLMRDFSPLADFQAAGIVGNGGGESGGFTLIQELKPTVKGSKGGLGFFQWTGMKIKPPGRRRVFEALLKTMGRGPDSYDANYEMLKTELKGSEKAAIPAVRKTKDIDEATKIFMLKFERPDPKTLNYKGRVTWAARALAAYQAEEKKIAKDPPAAK